MAHNRCVLKERRIFPGALTCFAVAECWGGRNWLVGGGGSAGSVLRSQGTLGPVGLSRGRARGIRMSTFLCSLRTEPAAARSTLPNPLCEHRRQGRSPALKYMGALSPLLRRRSAGAGAWESVPRGGAEGFGVPQRGTVYQPGVKPRVWRTTFRFTEEKHPHCNGCACLIAYSKNPRVAAITRST
jgi:hypothetical protein